MTGLIEKNYGDALFQVILADTPKQLDSTAADLKLIDDVLAQCPEFVKFVMIPTIDLSDKLELLNEAFEGRVNGIVLNLLSLLVEAGRLSHFSGIYRRYLHLYREEKNLGEITVTTAMPLNDVQKEKIIAKMSEITGKTITLTEKLDKDVIGGIIIDYGTDRFDGSVKTRLENLRKNISEIIA